MWAVNIRMSFNIDKEKGKKGQKDQKNMMGENLPLNLKIANYLKFIHFKKNMYWEHMIIQLKDY